MSVDPSLVVYAPQSAAVTAPVTQSAPVVTQPVTVASSTPVVAPIIKPLPSRRRPPLPLIPLTNEHHSFNNSSSRVGRNIFWLCRPDVQQRQRSLGAARTIRKRLANSKELISERDALLAKLNTFSQPDINRLQTLLPDSVDSVTLIIELNSIAHAVGMRVRKLYREPPRRARPARSAPTRLALWHTCL